MSKVKFDTAMFHRHSYGFKSYIEKILKVSVSEVDYSNENLSGLDLSGTDFGDADFSHSDLHNANLCDCKFSGNMDGANLYGAAITGTEFKNCCMRHTNIESTNIGAAKFTYCDLYYANFSWAKIRTVTFEHCNMCGADFINGTWEKVKILSSSINHAIIRSIKMETPPVIKNTSTYETGLALACPETGSFEAWKVVKNNHGKYLIKLLIPADAKRSSATTCKCRCSKAKVLDIIRISAKRHVKSVVNYAYFNTTVYTVGKMVYPDSFDKNRWNECSNGIHFFISKKNALDYIAIG